MERLSRALSKHEDAGVMIEVQSPQHQILAATFDWVKYPVGEGAFSVASDRAKVGQAVRALLREKMNYYLNTGDLHNFRVMMSLQDVNDKITKHDRIMQFAPNTTILDICCFLKHNECLKLLLEAHADCSRKDGYGAMASHWAAVGPNPAGLRILKDGYRVGRFRKDLQTG
eukprot:g24400.t1